MNEFERICKLIDGFRNDMIDMQIKLCSTPAVSPASGGEGEAKKAEFLLGFLKEMGMKEIKVIKASDLDAHQGHRPNIIAKYPGRSSDKTIWILTHMDVVPPGELAQWRGNPFRPWVEKGRIYGRGVEDNQQDMVASLYAIRAFREGGIQPNYNIGIILASDEETGNLKGIEYVLNMFNPFRKHDLIIAPDAGNSDGTLIEVAEKSILWMRVRTLGTQAHGSTPSKGVNSLKAASYLIARLSRLYQIFNAEDPLFDPPISTFEPTKKEANVPNINTIPGEDIFYLDCRVLPQYSLEEVKNSIREIADEIEQEFSVRIQFEDVQYAPAAPPTSPDSTVVKALTKAIKEVYGVVGKPTGIGGGTVAAFIRARDHQAVCWSRIDETAHQPNEYCIVENMLGDAKVFAHIFLQD